MSTTRDGVWIAWSGGKDSAFTVVQLRREGFRPAGLISTVVGSPPVVPFHGIPLSTLQQQAQALGLQLVVVRFRRAPSDRLYTRRFRAVLRHLRCRALAFGDIFLSDVRRFREQMLRGLPLQLLFPLWGIPTTELAARILASGIQALITCVDTRCLSPEHLGKPYDEHFLQALPPTVDPCGERGEFHTCVLAMPDFRTKLHMTSALPTTWAQHWQGYLITTAVAHASG